MSSDDEEQLSPEEAEAVKRALSLNRRPARSGVKLLAYTTETELIADVKQLYPTATNLTILNADCRDAAGVPLFHTRELRPVNFTIKRLTYLTGRVETTVEAEWKTVFAYVENGLAVLKVMKHKIGESQHETEYWR